MWLRRQELPALLAQGLLRCTRCGEVKPLEAFLRQYRATDVPPSWCKRCNVRRARGQQASRGPKKRPSPESERTYNRRYRERHPERHRAHWTVSEALRKGDLVRATGCQLCGRCGRLEAHHADYGRPLDVVWLCRDCHELITFMDKHPDPTDREQRRQQYLTEIAELKERARIMANVPLYMVS